MLEIFKPKSDFFNKGTVVIAGAGPGDEKNLTLATYFAIKIADVIIYDGLVGKRILNLAKKSANLIFAGKKFGNKSCTQKQIIDWLQKYSIKNKKVLRLKGGDPSIFGRGAEEIEALKKLKIKFKILSGITAAQEVFVKYNQKYDQIDKFFTFATGHKNINEESIKVNFSNFVRNHSKVVIYMGLSQLRNICNKLLDSGKSKKTKVIIATNISLKNEKIVESDLQSCLKTQNNFGLKPPAIIIIG